MLCNIHGNCNIALEQQVGVILSEHVHTHHVLLDAQLGITGTTERRFSDLL